MRDMMSTGRLRAVLVGVLCISLATQLYHHSLLLLRSRESSETVEIQALNEWKKDQSADKNAVDGPFGACLMIKQGNDLLYEWIAYHWTTLNLSHLVVGSDEGNTEDPNDVLKLWKGLLVHSQVVNASEFVERHGRFQSKAKDSPTKNAHHALIHRQKGFITTCLEILHKQGVHWTALIDNDEFVAGNVTISHFLRDKKTPCVTLPRVLVGALENRSCHEREDVSFTDDNADLTTLRHVQTAKRGDFGLSKFGKTLIDLSRIDETILYQPIRNIHRPFRDLCGPAFVADSDVVLFHYLQSWDRYAARSDGRRSRSEWEKRAFLDDDTTCHLHVDRWYSAFLRRVGKESAKKLLPSAKID